MSQTRRSFFRALGVGALTTLGAAWPLNAWGWWRQRSCTQLATFPPDATKAKINYPLTGVAAPGGGGFFVWGDTDGNLRAEVNGTSATGAAITGNVIWLAQNNPAMVGPCRFAFSVKLPDGSGKATNVTVAVFPNSSPSGTKALHYATFDIKALDQAKLPGAK